MALFDRIKEARIKKGLTQTELGKLIGVAKTTVAGYEKNHEPTAAKLGEIADVLDVDVNFLLQDEVKAQSSARRNALPVAQPPHYADLLDEYRAIVDATSEQAYKAQTLAVKAALAALQEDAATGVPNNVIEIEKRRVALYEVRPSAGRGNILNESPYTIVEIGPEAPIQTSYVLTCGGNSMEPKLHDGDLLYVKEQDYVEDGEIGIFVYDDNVYVKKQERHGNNCYLVSLNPEYKPIKINDNLEFCCLGKVLN